MEKSGYAGDGGCAAPGRGGGRDRHVAMHGARLCRVRDILDRVPEIRYLMGGTGAFLMDVWTMSGL